MSHKIFLILICVITIIVSCNSNQTSEKDLALQKKELDLKQKELELKEKQLALDSAQKSQSASAKSTTVKNEQTNKGDQIEKKLLDEEYGEYNANLSGGQMAWYVTIKLIRNTNKASYVEATDPRYGYESIESKGTFIINDVTNDYKFVTCKFDNGKIMKLKYSIKKKKWIATSFDGGELNSEMNPI